MLSRLCRLSATVRASKNIHVRDVRFQAAVEQFSQHTSNDRWPIEHEAAGLPKDGFAALLDTSGYRLRCAVRLTGLPTPPFRWDGVGTRHVAALSLSWCLRNVPAVVVVRSDSGKVHGLLWSVDGG